MCNEREPANALDGVVAEIIKALAPRVLTVKARDEIKYIIASYGLACVMDSAYRAEASKACELAAAKERPDNY